MSRSRSGVIALMLLLAACGGGDNGAASAELTPAPGEDVLVTQDRNPIIARNSPVLVVNPTQRTNMVVVDRVSRPDFSAGVHVTNNGGTVWQDVALKVPSAGGKPFAPSAAYDRRGMLYVSYVTLSGPGNDPESFWVARSGDGGLSFDEPTKIAGPETFHTTLAVDADTGRLFAAWVQSNAPASTCELCFAQTGLPIVVSRSDDAGRTWSPPIQVSDAGRLRVGAPSVAVDSEGNPSVLYMDYGDDRVDWENLPGRYDGRFSLVLTRSVDEGRQWGPGRVVDADIVPTGRFLVYSPVTPGFAIGSDGAMYAVWADARAGDADILLRRSTDDGRTWAEPVQVNRGAPGDGVPQDMPSVDVAPKGRVDVVYYDRTIDRRGSMADVLLSSSTDSGASFTKHFRLSDAASNRKVGPEATRFSEEADFGTRISVASLSGGAIAAWTDTRNGTLEGGKQDIFTAQVPVADNSPLSLTYRLLAGLGILLGVAGVTLFVLSWRSRKRTPPPPRADMPTDDPPPPPLVPSPGQA